MIDIKELKVGNWIKFTSTGECEIVEDIQTHDQKEPSVNRVVVAAIEPIPLTPEILEKIEGVEKDDKYESFYYLDHPLFSCKVYKKAGLPMEITADGVVRYACDKIKHLHTFQNVIHALTQTELQIKL